MFTLAEYNEHRIEAFSGDKTRIEALNEKLL